jgi:hypothetical protein
MCLDLIHAYIGVFVKQIAWRYLHSGGILHGGLWPSIGTEVEARFGIDIQILGNSCEDSGHRIIDL